MCCRGLRGVGAVQGFRADDPKLVVYSSSSEVDTSEDEESEDEEEGAS